MAKYQKHIAPTQNEVQLIPPLNGLVLAGGKSRRMGQDKGLIDYHGKPQRDYIADILNNYCTQTFFSFRQGQTEIATIYPIIEDSSVGLGPFGAIVSAFFKYPNHAWLVVACDLPLLDEITIQYLIDNRNSSKVATAFNNPIYEFPEPLTTIWEPKSYPILLRYSVEDCPSPKKVLVSSDVHLLNAPDSKKLINVNHPQEMELVRNTLKLEREKY